MRSLGIDPSTTATGLVALEGKLGREPVVLMERELKKSSATGVERTRSIVSDIIEAIHETKPDKIVVEGYSLSMKNVSSVIPLVELGGLLRFCMWLDGLRWYDPRASELKKFVAGAGNVGKEQVMMWVLKRWGHTSLSNNTADAYGLAAMGLALGGGLSGMTKDQIAVIGKLEERSN